MSRTETRPGTVGIHGLDRTNDIALHGRRTAAPTAGIVHDLGNFIQVASSALNRVARDPSVSMAPALEPVIASAKTALVRAGTLVRETIGRAQENNREVERTSVTDCLTEVETLIRCAWESNIRL